jgi:short-subunit dehydrogenase
MRGIQDKTVLLTGATGGIGRSLALSLAREGASIMLAARSAGELELLRGELRALGARAETVAGDLLDDGYRRNLPLRTRSALGEIDVLINNAGVDEFVEFAEQQSENIQRILDLNIAAPMMLTRELLPSMVERRAGHIVNMASLAGRVATPYAAVYSGSKAALAQWSFSLAAELRDTGVAVSVICPGFVADAGMFARRQREAPGVVGACAPEDVAAAVLHAIRDRAMDILVTPRPARPLVALQAMSPRLITRLTEKLGLKEFLQSLTRP